MEFDIIRYVEEKGKQKIPVEEQNSPEKMKVFETHCQMIKQELDEIEKKESAGKEETILNRQRKAILGFEKEVRYYKNLIQDIVHQSSFKDQWYPSWYSNMSDAVYNEILGFAGLAEWIENRTPELADSSSAKVIGDRIYFMISGEMVLQPQKISTERRKQLKAALLLATPEKRAKEVYHEVYLQDGSRVTLYNEGLTKAGQESIVIRKFLVKEYNFEQQAERHTIPQEAIPLFTAMVEIGFNVAFIGPVRSAKTTFLTTWQKYEDPKLEGVIVESDPEIPLHLIMPSAPILQFVPSDEDFPLVVKRIMRSDADYIIMAEARDGIALNTAVQAANKGTRRTKITFHSSDALDFCFDVATEIIKTYGGDLSSTITKVAKSFQYIFQMVQLPDKSKKRLKAIWEIRYDLKKRQITMHRICKYDFQKDDWTWANTIGEDKKEIGMEENKDALRAFENTLKQLAQSQPMKEESPFVPFYDQLIRGSGS